MAKKRNQKRHGELPKFIGLGVLILIVYANSFSAGMVFDSAPIIQDDPRLRQLTFNNLEQIFTLNYWWPSQDTPLYRPLTTLSYLFNYTVLGNGENVAGYHAVNFLLHWTNAWLVLLIVRRLAGRAEIALLTACLFAVHPVNTEAVTNIVGRADLKSDRAEGALTVNTFHLEPGVRRSAALDDAFSRALDRLRRTVGLERVVRP